MKFMISCRQSLPILKQADEIKVDYIDKERIIDLINNENVYQGEINIYIPNKTNIDWDFLNKYKQVLKIVLAVENPNLIPVCKKAGFKTFWSFPISSFWELNTILKLGADEVLLDAPLYFDLDNVKYLCKNNVEIRLVVNQCFNPYLPKENGIEGTYVRPEDVEAYSKYVDHMEFVSENLKQELTLLKIYSKQKNWPGNLNLLLTNLNENIDNRGLNYVNFAEKRMNCKQRCQINKCHFCKVSFSYINTLGKNAEKILKAIEKADLSQEEIVLNLDEEN